MCRALVTALAACRFRAPACQFISWSASASRSFWRTRVFSLLTVLGATPHWSAISAGDLPINVSRIKAASRGQSVLDGLEQGLSPRPGLAVLAGARHLE